MKSGRQPFRSEESGEAPSREQHRAERQAADWLALRALRPLSDEEERDFAAWRAAKPLHERTVRDLETAWRALDRLADYPRGDATEPDPELLSVPAKQMARRSRRSHAGSWRAGAAAALLAASIAVAFIVSGRQTSREASDFRSLAGAEEAREASQWLRLEDGSVAELRADGALDPRFDASERRVRLVRGEAHFSVRRDPGRPFIVETGDVAVRAVGTAFSVRVTPDSVSVLVTEGVVRLGTSTELTAGQRTVVSTTDRIGPRTETTSAPVVETLSQRDMDAALSWRNRTLVFDAEPLERVVEAFNRRNVRQLVIGTPGIGAMRIGGRFRAENLDGFIELLQSSFGVRTVARGDILVLEEIHEKKP